MVPRGRSVIEMPRLERAINNARWVGAVALVAIGPFFQSVGAGTFGLSTSATSWWVYLPS